MNLAGRLLRPQGKLFISSRFLSTMKAKKWVIGERFQGEPRDENLKLVEEDLPALKDGDVMLEALCWSVDPYMRPRAGFLRPGQTMVGQHIARVIESKNPKYPVGKMLGANIGWRTHSVLNPETMGFSDYNGMKVPIIENVAEIGREPVTSLLGVLGMPGATAYLGLMEICNPQPGETVLVTGAAGAVGSLVGQIAKIKGCRVIGFAGTEEKVRYIKEELGFDFAYNYKTADVSEALREAAPNGIDCFFDNVGGDLSTQVIWKHLNMNGRISQCGAIARYNDDATKRKMAPEMYSLLVFKQIRWEGFIVYKWVHKYQEAYTELAQWIREGKIKYKEHRTVGFHNMKSAFYGMLKGDNTGKAVIVPATSKL